MASLFACGSHKLLSGKTMRLSVVDAQSRLRRVRDCTDANTLREALAVPGLQKTVRTAIEAKLRKMERAA